MKSLKERSGVEFALPDEMLVAIGGVTAIYSSCEFLSAIAAWHALDLPAHEGTLLTGSKSLGERLELVLALGPRRNIQQHQLDILAKIRENFVKSSGLAQRRNLLIHAVWARRWSDNRWGDLGPVTFSRAGKPIAGPPIKLDDIDELIKKIAVQRDKLQQIIMVGWSATVQLRI